MLDINELSKQIGLSVKQIRKSVDAFGDILDDHLKRGTHNRLLFDSNCIVIFEKIKRLKDQGLGHQEIKRQLGGNLKTNEKDPKNSGAKLSETDIKEGGVGINSNLMQEIISLHKQLAEEKDNRINEQKVSYQEMGDKEEQIKELEKSNIKLTEAFKLLPEGKEPEEIKRMWEGEQKRKQRVIQIVGELKNLGLFTGRKRKKLTKELEELMEQDLSIIID